MNEVALWKQVEKIDKELKASGEYTTRHFMDIRIRLDRLELKMKTLMRWLAAEFPDFSEQFDRLYEQVTWEEDPEKQS
jgi:hypothetical protein